MTTHTYTALITPFKDGALDEKSFEELINYQIIGGIDGIVPCGTTGESPTLTHQEHNFIIERAVEISKGRIKVMAGTGSNSTHEAVATTEHAKMAGADSCLVVTPYYNKPNREGVIKHFEALNEVGIDIIIYNIPGRSVINMSDEDIAKLSNLKNIAGIKDATGDLARVASLRNLVTKKDFIYLSGEDITAVGFNAMGGNGIISVTSNIAPKLISELQKACKSGDYKRALQIQDKIVPLSQSLFADTNPIPIKYAASLMGLCSGEIRLPLCQPNEALKTRIKDQMVKIGLI